MAFYAYNTTLFTKILSGLIVAWGIGVPHNFKPDHERSSEAQDLFMIEQIHLLFLTSRGDNDGLELKLESWGANQKMCHVNKQTKWQGEKLFICLCQPPDNEQKLKFKLSRSTCNVHFSKIGIDLWSPQAEILKH